MFPCRVIHPICNHPGHCTACPCSIHEACHVFGNAEDIFMALSYPRSCDIAMSMGHFSSPVWLNMINALRARRRGILISGFCHGTLQPSLRQRSSTHMNKVLKSTKTLTHTELSLTDNEIQQQGFGCPSCNVILHDSRHLVPLIGTGKCRVWKAVLVQCRPCSQLDFDERTQLV